jgi:hypothetical protein
MTAQIALLTAIVAAALVVEQVRAGREAADTVEA